MDPQACFQRFIDAVANGDYGEAYEAMYDYLAWTEANGFRARDKDGSEVVKFDAERDRYLVLADGGQEVWRFPLRDY